MGLYEDSPRELTIELAVNVSEDGCCARCSSPPRSSYCAAPDISGSEAPSAETIPPCASRLDVEISGVPWFVSWAGCR